MNRCTYLPHSYDYMCHIKITNIKDDQCIGFMQAAVTEKLYTRHT